MDGNFSFLFQYLKKENINIDQDEFTFQVQSHADYPSLLAVSDTLSFFNIDNLATRIDFEDIIHLPERFVALLNGTNNKTFLALVEKEGEGFKFQQEKERIKVSGNAFKDIFQNIVLLAEKEEVDEVKTKAKFNPAVLLLLGATFFIAFLALSKVSVNVILFAVLAVIGVYFSVEAIFKELGIQSKFSESVCTITASADCDTVIKSKGLSFLEKFNYTNFGATFFITQLLLLFVMLVGNKVNAFFEVQFILLLCAIPVTFLSVYHQAVIAKKWCPICLFIIGLLYVELLLIYFLNPVAIQFDVLNAVVFLFLFTMTYFFVNMIKEVFKLKNAQRNELLAANRFKRNFKLFKSALNDADTANVELDSCAMIVGNPNAKLVITLVTNPFCGFCKEAHKIIENIYKAHKEDICINFSFNYNIQREKEKSKEIHHKLVQIYFDQGPELFMEAMKNWFEKDIAPTYDKVFMNELKINEILNQQFLSNERNNITFTPGIVLNNAIFPKCYDRNDLIYFIPELLDELK